MKAREDLYNDLVDMGFLRVGEGDIKVLTKTPALYLTLPCDYWESKHENGFWTFVSPMVVSFYAFVTTIHDFFNK